MNKNNNSGVKGLADVDTRLKKLNKRVADLEETMRKLEKVWSLISCAEKRKQNGQSVASWWLISFAKNKVFLKYGIAVSAAVKIMHRKLPLYIISPPPVISPKLPTYKPPLPSPVLGHLLLNNNNKKYIRL